MPASTAPSQAMAPRTQTTGSRRMHTPPHGARRAPSIDRSARAQQGGRRHASVMRPMDPRGRAILASCMLRPLVAPRRLQALQHSFLLEERGSLLRHDLRNKVATIRNATFYLKRKVEGAAAELWRADERVGRFFTLIQG